MGASHERLLKQFHVLPAKRPHTLLKWLAYTTYTTAHHRHSVQIKNEGGRIRPPSQRAIYYSHSMVIVLPPRHSSCAWFSVPPRAECRQVTPCRVSSASGTKAGTTLKTFFKLRALSFCFCPKGRGGTPLQAQYRRKRPFRNSIALLPASRQLQSQVNQRGRLSCWLKNRRSQLFVVRG